MTEPVQPGKTCESFPRFSWWRVLVGAALPLMLIAAYLQLIRLVMHPELPFSLEGFFLYAQLLPLLLGLPMLLLGILAESIQPGLSDRAFLLTGAYAGAAAGFTLSQMAALPAAAHLAPGAAIGLLTALAMRAMWRRTLA
ncbi:hypothetical protein GCM10017783_01610 [Deinococcus piscis]|uniref:Uncharacterized protein n=1 Tax=Deinococcus piscis TaxID=394230 RepID=A0ABQ3K3D7_9DEIO|nr:hypothetical protein [Deinococcus piscis]GHF93331.1 hypothetical protein GCM10017783_01610 [Deinococcus piscis]